jgi:hypothetical protein
MHFFLFPIYLILPAALDYGDYSASNKHEYQKEKNVSVGVKRCRRVRLTSPPGPVIEISLF